MIAMTNANMKNLPTTPAPAPEKSWDKRDRAERAATIAVGPESMKGVHWDVDHDKANPKRWVWYRIDPSKRAPLSAQVIKANGGKDKAAETVDRADQTAGEMVASAAVEKIMANARKPINLTTDENGFPAFPKREGHETPEQQQARIEAMKKVVGPGRKIKDPPNVNSTKAKAKKEKKTSIAFVAKSAIMAGKDNDKALGEVLAVFPNCGYKESDVQWYRRKLVKEGKLKDTAPPKKSKSK